MQSIPTGEIRIDHIKHKNSESDRSTHIHVTDLSRCLAGAYQEKVDKIKTEANESMQRRWDAGHNIEERVIEAYKHAGLFHSTQGSLNWPEYNMVGSYDLISKEDGQLWLIEVKSIHVFGMDHLYKSGKIHDHYREQVNLYLNKLREEYPGIKAKIYYEALDGRTFETEIEYDPSIVEDALKRAALLHKAIEENKMPEPLPIFIQEDGKWKLNWRVKYCIESGMHAKCDPKTNLDPDPKKCVSKLTYKATKFNK